MGTTCLGCGRVPVTGGFQDVTGQGSRKSYSGSLCHKRLDKMILQGPFQPRPFYDSIRLLMIMFCRYPQ